jgi:hypothetical protein
MNIEQIDKEIATLNSNTSESQELSEQERIDQAIKSAKLSYKEDKKMEEELLNKLTVLYSQKAKYNPLNKSLCLQQINTTTTKLELVRKKLIVPIENILYILEKEKQQLPIINLTEQKSKYTLKQLNIGRRLRFAFDQHPDADERHINNILLTQKIPRLQHELYKKLID